MTVLVEEVGISLAVTLSVVDTVGDAVGDGVENVVGDDGDIVGEEAGAFDVQHVSTHSSATLGTMHWFVWRNNANISGSNTSGNRGMFDRAHTGLDVGEIAGDAEWDNVGENEGEVVGEAVGAIEGDTVGPTLGDKCW